MTDPRDERDAHDPWHSPDWDDVWWWCDARIGDEFPDLRGVA